MKTRFRLPALQIYVPACENVEATLSSVQESIGARWKTAHKGSEAPVFTLLAKEAPGGIFVEMTSACDPGEWATLKEFALPTITHELRRANHMRSAPEDSPCVVDIGAKYAHLPCATYSRPEFLEALWRQTGADVPGEHASYACVCGLVHPIVLIEQNEPRGMAERV